MTYISHLFYGYFPRISAPWQIVGLFIFALTFASSWMRAKNSDVLRPRFWRALSFSAAASYAFLLLAMLVLSRGTRADYSYNLELLHSYRRLLAGGLGASELGALALFNCLLFMPFGFFLAAELTLWRGNDGGVVRMAALCGFAYSLLLETLQLVLRRGTCELDDILHNTIGAVLGALLWKAAQALYLHIKRSSARD